MIDWKNIKKDNPMAYEMWINSCGSASSTSLNTLIGHLLSFFDGQSINVLPETSYSSEDGGKLWYCWLEIEGDLCWEDHNRHNDRNQALAAAFTEAFKILEEGIENGNL